MSLLSGNQRFLSREAERKKFWPPRAGHRLEARGETIRLSPEKVGHRLKKLGLRTRPLSQAGNGLTFDKTTVAEIQQLAVMHGMEDMPAET
jgi:hypothetical protein